MSGRTEFFSTDNCPDCNHPITQHIGMVDMGGDHSEALGCIAADVNGNPMCFCDRHEFEGLVFKGIT